MLKYNINNYDLKFCIRKPVMENSKTVKSQLINLCKNTRGVAIIEMAIILPILLVVVFAVLEFGNYYMREFIAQRALSNVVSYVQTAYPNSSAQDDANINAAVANLLPSLGGGLISTTDMNNSLCAWAANSGNLAAVETQVWTSGICGPSAYHLGRGYAPYGLAPTMTYWVAFSIIVPYHPLTALPTLAGLTMPTMIRASTAAQIAPATPTPPTATCTSGQQLNYAQNATTDATGNAVPANSYYCDISSSIDFTHPTGYSNSTTPIPYKVCIPASVAISICGHCDVYRNGDGTWSNSHGVCGSGWVGCSMYCYN